MEKTILFYFFCGGLCSPPKIEIHTNTHRHGAVPPLRSLRVDFVLRQQRPGVAAGQPHSLQDEGNLAVCHGVGKAEPDKARAQPLRLVRFLAPSQAVSVQGVGLRQYLGGVGTIVGGVGLRQYLQNVFFFRKINSGKKCFFFSEIQHQKIKFINYSREFSSDNIWEAVFFIQKNKFRKKK